MRALCLRSREGRDITVDENGYARWFRDSTPYISMHRERTFVVLLDGAALEHPNISNIVHDLALVHVLGARLVLVHGARPQIDARLPDSSFHAGRRITPEAHLASFLGVCGELKSRLEALFSIGLCLMGVYILSFSIPQLIEWSFGLFPGNGRWYGLGLGLVLTTLVGLFLAIRTPGARQLWRGIRPMTKRSD